MTEAEFLGHLDEICCPNCHVAIDDEGQCPKCGSYPVTVEVPD